MRAANGRVCWRCNASSMFYDKVCNSCLDCWESSHACGGCEWCSVVFSLESRQTAGFALERRAVGSRGDVAQVCLARVALQADGTAAQCSGNWQCLHNDVITVFNLHNDARQMTSCCVLILLAALPACCFCCYVVCLCLHVAAAILVVLHIAFQDIARRVSNVCCVWCRVGAMFAFLCIVGISRKRE